MPKSLKYSVKDSVTLMMVLSLSMATLRVMAQPALTPAKVIADQGATVPIAPFMGALLPQKIDQRRPNMPAMPKTPFSSMFPLRTTFMKPGILKNAPKLKTYFTLPMYVVGNDDLSKKWLGKNLPTLAKIRAVGLMVNAKTENEFFQFKKDNGLQSLPLVPQHGDDLLKSVPVKTYPYLLRADGRVVQ